MLIEKIIQWATKEEIEVTEQEIRDYYDSHIEEFHKPYQVKVRQITVMDEDTARSISTRLNRGADFSELAKTYSTSPDSSEGGDIGYFGKGELPIEFEKQVFKMRVNQISNVVKSPYGFHLFKVEDIQNEKNLNLEEATPEITSIIKRVKLDSWYKNLMKEMQLKFPVTINQELLEQAQS